MAGAHPLKRFNKKGKKGNVLIIILILNKIICMERQHSLIIKRAGSEVSLAWTQSLTWDQLLDVPVLQFHHL